jgi:hypothetical protein
MPVAAVGDRLAALDRRTRADQPIRIVRVHRFITVIVIDQDILP